MLTDAKGIPLEATVTGANAADVPELLPLVDAIPDLSGEEEDKPTQPEVLLRIGPTIRNHAERN